MRIFCNVTTGRSTGFNTAIQERMQDAEVASTHVVSIQEHMLHASIPLQTRFLTAVSGVTRTVRAVNIVTWMGTRPGVPTTISVR